jgi:3-oxoacyl-[acyl-carrier protein] reductase
MHNKDHGKWILVTGGTRGIGRQLVIGLSKAGYDVMFTFKSSLRDAAELESNSTPDALIKGFQCDCTDLASVNELASSLVTEFGAPYCVINNAGITKDSLMMNMPFEDWQSVITNNINSTFLVSRAFIHSMIENSQGIIIQMSSVSGLRGISGQTNYSSSKSAMIAFTQSLALEVARFNIRVNAVAPGYINTAMVDAIQQDEIKKIEKRIPLRRMGTVEDVSNLVEFLVSDKASYITGQTFVVDGGLSV